MDPYLCSICKGRLYCRRPSCMILDRIKELKQTVREIGQDFSGSSPPSVFVGRANYPNVNVGTLAPTAEGDTGIYDEPSAWFNEKMGIEDVLNYRSSLINNRTRQNVYRDGKFLSEMQEIAMAKKSVEIEAHFKKPLKPQIKMQTLVPAMGPSGEVEKLDITENVRVSGKVDKVVSDTDLKSLNAMKYLYEHNIDENAIMKILSIGLLGVKASRKLVPTRWSITAVDSNLGNLFVKQIKDHPPLNEILLFHDEYIGNRYEILFIPGTFEYELIEIKHPRSVWNPLGREPFIYGNYEPVWGRTKYAEETAGAFYAGRLTIAEKLGQMRRQGSVLIVREVTSDYWAPVGIWQMRETCRSALSGKPEKFDTINSALNRICSRLQVRDKWIGKSKLVKLHKTQRKLFDYRV